MRWQDLEESSSVEDRRGLDGMGRPGGFRTRSGIPLRGKTGLAVVIVVLVAGYYGIDLTPLLTGEPFPVETQMTASAPYKGTAAEEELAKFSRVALKTTEDVWNRDLPRHGREVSAPEARALHGQHLDRLRLRPVGDGPLLLSRRQEGLP